MFPEGIPPSPPTPSGSRGAYLGPMRSPTKLISGYSSCGIITLSLTRVAGGLGEGQKKKSNLQGSPKPSGINPKIRMWEGPSSLVVSWGLEVGVQGHHLGDEVVPLLLQLLARAELPRVQALPLAVVDGLRGGGPAPGGGGVTGKPPDPSEGAVPPAAPPQPSQPPGVGGLPSPRCWQRGGGCGGVGRGQRPFGGGGFTPPDPSSPNHHNPPPMATLCHCPHPPPGGANWGGEH